MNLKVAIAFFLLSCLLFLANSGEEEKASKEESKEGPKELNIEELCKRDVCKSSIKVILEGDKDVKPGKFAEKVLVLVQNEYGHTTIKVREHMEKKTTSVEVKKVLSHCLKLYLDISHELRGCYLALRSKDYGEEATEFSRMTKRFPNACEDGLKNAKTSGKDLGLYNDFNHDDLTDIASALEQIIHHAGSQSKKGGSR